MAHHKRKRAANQRAGCKLCKSWKVNGVSTECDHGESISAHKRRKGIIDDMKADLREMNDE